MNDIKRVLRLTAILIQLQAQRLLIATYIAEKFNVSVHTIYSSIHF
nr:HTH domain-containing protein [Myroides marinus]